VTARVWIDTDLGDNPDDAVALLLAVAHPSIDLVGISTVGGDVVRRAEAARDLLAASGVAPPLIYAGAPDPRALAAADAMLAIGPLTNIAALLRAGATVPATCMMGGVLEPTRHRGELRDRETNVATDPTAAALVVEQAPELLVVPLDVTASMSIDTSDVARLVAARPALASTISAWSWPVCLHDPLALLALMGEYVTIERRPLAVTDAGRLVVDVQRGVERDVVSAADIAAARDRVLSLLT
jgi:inosine-uridine nucleoside N-ribohydrolase